MQQERVEFDSGEFKLEGILDVPSPAHLSGAGVVVCHPHPQYGGTMENNVTRAVSKALVDRGIQSLRFNFRGVGKSQGSFAHGKGEVDDALAALSYLAQLESINYFQLGLAGYSFGGAIALEAGLLEEKVKALAAVSPAGLPSFTGSTKPRFIVSGEKDDLIPPSSLLQYRQDVEGEGKGSIKIIEGADHFWAARKYRAAEMIAEFFEACLI